MISALQAPEGGQDCTGYECWREGMTSTVNDLSGDIVLISATALSISLIVMGFVLLPESNRTILKDTQNLERIVERSKAALKLWILISAGGVAIEAFLDHWPYRFRVPLSILMGLVYLYCSCRFIGAGLPSQRENKNAHPIVRFQIGLIYSFFFATVVLVGMWTHLILQANGANSYPLLAFVILYFTTALFVVFLNIGFELLKYMVHYASRPAPRTPGQHPDERPVLSIGPVRITLRRRRP